MKCKKCGGLLKFENGIYVCESCNNKYGADLFYENTDVAICYIEADDLGRRTKDSILAQDLYNRLQNSNINTFYQRISIANLTGMEYQINYDYAVSKSKIIVVLGTSKENFKKILKENHDKFADKKIIPVYSGISAYDIPHELKNLQALNYDNVGAITDLVYDILLALGRESEARVSDIHKNALSKKKRTAMVIISCLTVIAIILGGYIVTCTPYVLKSKQYECAGEFAEEGKYVKAISLYKKLGNYKNSLGELRKIYTKYDGYYVNKDNTVYLHMDIENTQSMILEVSKISENEMSKFSTEILLTETNLKFEFNDSHGIIGTGQLALNDNGIQLSVNSDNSEGASIWNFKYLFELKDKSDAPLSQMITKNVLLEWISKKTSKDDIISDGYELTPAGTDTFTIENTDIKLLFLNIDLQKSGDNYTKYYQTHNDEYMYIDCSTDEQYLYAFSAPEDIILEKSDNKNPVIFDDKFIYVRNADVGELHELCITPHRITSLDSSAEKKAPVFVTSSNILGRYYWWTLCLDIFRKEFKLEQVDQIVHEDEQSIYAVQTEYYPDEEHLGIGKENPGKYKLWKLSKDTLSITAEKDQGFENDASGVVLDAFLGEFAKDILFR